MNLVLMLKEVDLSDIIVGCFEVEVLKVMEIFSEGLFAVKLTSVDLSDNAFGEKGVCVCMKFF